jgi:hypothetical protein
MDPGHKARDDNVERAEAALSTSEDHQSMASTPLDLKMSRIRVE